MRNRSITPMSLMAIGTGFAVVCGEAITQPQHREAVFDQAAGGRPRHHRHHPRSDARVRRQTCWNWRRPGGRIIALSTTAWRSLGSAQRRTLESHADMLPVEIPTIERIGGGGVRCMLAEMHLPKRL